MCHPKVEEGIITVAGVGGPPIRTEADLERACTITLAESDTIWLLDLPSSCVALDTEEAEDVQTSRKLYEEVRMVCYNFIASACYSHVGRCLLLPMACLKKGLATAPQKVNVLRSWNGLLRV